MSVQQRILNFVNRSNWMLLIGVCLAGLTMGSVKFFSGLLVGGIIVTVNFFFLARTLKKSLDPQNITSHSHSIVLAKYYLRFIISGILIFIVIHQHLVDPQGLLIGLSVVVASIVLATLSELKRIIFKEAT